LEIVIKSSKFDVLKIHPYSAVAKYDKPYNPLKYIL
jgi:hypothetical protein